MSDEPVTILVVDDEPEVLGIVSMHLQLSGYTVLVANSGEEALAVLDGPTNVALVLADCNMRGISGPELDVIILARWPHIKVVAMSGRPRSPELPDTIEFISKPFRRADLIAVIEQVLRREVA